MKFDISLENGIHVATVAGRIDAVTTSELEEALMALAQRAEGPVLLDFSEVEYVGSLGLQVLARAAAVLKERGIPLRLCGLQPFVAEVFRITHFIRLFHVDETREAAMAALGDAATKAAPS